MTSYKRQVKGISPLIAVIMLIAFTLVVAGILAGWATNFAQEQRTVIEQCSDARVIIYSASQDATTGKINLVVYNNGKIPLNFKTILSFTNGSLVIDESTEATEVDAGKVETFVISPPYGNFDDLSEITIQSLTCFGAQDFIEARNVRDL
ncbi:MAG: archaellin/type IV pilin N-terminal domain-containing protein [Candidatus Aenigmatarchaeota archaeon]|nr:hypothetical protein [Nanoarchaeota archaeon]